MLSIAISETKKYRLTPSQNQKIRQAKTLQNNGLNKESKKIYYELFLESPFLKEAFYPLEGMENNKDLTDMVDYYFNNWIGNVNETAFMVNILMLDNKNALCSTDNTQVREAMKRHGIELHITPFKHKWFWDCGIHCLTQDLDRE